MNIPDWLQVMALAAVPITEYQAAIPLGIVTFHLPPWLAYVCGVAGSLLPFPFIYLFLTFLRERVTRWFPWLARPIDRFVARAEQKTAHHYARYGAIGLFIALVIPVPLTGVWTTTAAAVALKIPPRAALLGIGLGLLSGAFWVTLITVGIV